MSFLYKEFPMDPHIPREIELQYEGQWMAWDTVTNQVIGHGKTMKEAMDRAQPAEQPGHLIWYHHVLPRNIEMIGGF